jgi:integrase
MGRKHTWPPKITRHPCGQARIYLFGRYVYLGVYGSEEAAKRYAEIIKHPPQMTKRNAGDSVATLALRYLRHAEGYYVDEDGRQTSQVEYVRRSMRLLGQCCGNEYSREFSPNSLKKVRAEMVRLGWSRGNVNQHVKVIRSAFRWAVSEEMIPVTVYQAIMTVPHLRAGRSEARETDAVQPVAMADIEAAIAALSPHLAAAVRLQLCCACRPGELLAMRAEQIDRSHAVWRWEAIRHKTRWRGKKRLVFFGPRAQAIIATLPSKGHLIQPRMATKTNGRTKVGERYSVRTYYRAVHRACLRAGVPPWSPHQLRHTAATLLAEEFGIETARIILGHSSLSATLIYAAPSLKKAEDAMTLKG